ncbi:hypothetical protein PGTUg99_021259 [Puccinia graminis f. sp. tritici]|uniref:Uncharacterized protein n=1 Tax=Puccinia graminis f. sp. tritici TaxID=56615 RepID=A0A5B0NJ42_PUCGR|nr:hypothetical protein PGTUg99_021259 [Puccinia graminis f. sp. tritici]
MAVPGTYRARRPADRSDISRTWQNTTSMTTVSMNPVLAQLDTLETKVNHPIDRQAWAIAIRTTNDSKQF